MGTRADAEAEAKPLLVGCHKGERAASSRGQPGRPQLTGDEAKSREPCVGVRGAELAELRDRLHFSMGNGRICIPHASTMTPINEGS